MQTVMQMMTTREAADRLGVSTSQVTRLVKRGEIEPAIQAPGKRGAFLFTVDEVEHCRAMRELRGAGKGKGNEHTTR